MVLETTTTAPVASDAAPVDATPQGAAPEATLPVPTEAESPATETATPETPKAWATIDGVDYTDDYEAFESEKFALHRERDQRRIEERLQTEHEARLQAATKSWESTQLNQQLQGFMGRFAQRFEDGDIDGADKILDRMLQFAEPYQEPYKQQVRTEGAQQAAGMLYREMLELTPSRRARDEFEDFATRAFQKEGEKAWPVVLKQLLKQASSEPAKAEYERGVKDGRAAAETEATAVSRNGQGPDTTPTRGSGGKSYSTMTFEERNALSPTERDALIAQER